MSELEIPKNTPRKRTSTDAIREGGESRKRACGTAKKGATYDGMAEDEAVARESSMYHQKLREGQKKRKGLSKESHAKECDYFHATRSAAVVETRAGFVLMECAAHVGTGGVPSA